MLTLTSLPAPALLLSFLTPIYKGLRESESLHLSICLPIHAPVPGWTSLCVYVGVGMGGGAAGREAVGDGWGSGLWGQKGEFTSTGPDSAAPILWLL